MSYFPNAPLPVRTFIAPGYDPASPTSWTWTEITTDVRYKTGIDIAAGRRDEGSHADPGKCTLTLDNRSGDYCSRNALGAYYPDLRRNTPLRVTVDRMADTFTRSGSGGWGTSDSGFAWSHTSSSTWTVSGTQGVTTFAAANTSATATSATGGALDVDIEYVVSISARTTGANWAALAIFRYVDANNFYAAGVEFDTTNTIKLSLHSWDAGVRTGLVSATSTGIGYSAGTKIRCRVVALGANLQAKAWLDGTTEPSDWNIEIQDTAHAGSTVGLYQWRIAGNTNAGSLAVSVDSYTASAVLFTGMVSEWPVMWDKTGNDSVVTIVANGVLRRLQQGASLQSPLYRQLIAQNPAGYWPGEDGSDATSMASGVAGGLRATVTDVTFAAESDLPGSDPVLKVNSSSSVITGTIPTYTATPDGYAAMALVKLPSLPGATTNLIEYRANGTVNRWLLDVDATSFGITGYANDGSTVVARTTGLTVINPRNWFAIQLETEEDGLGNVNWTLIWNAVGNGTFWFMNGSYAGSAERVGQFKVASALADTAYAHIWLGDNDLPFVADSFSQAAAGYAGELAAARVERLCDEQAVAVLVEDATTSEALDVQRAEPFVTLLQSVEDADLGILYEVGGGIGYRPRYARYNAPVDIALDAALGHLAEAPEPTDDDQRIRNDVTAKRATGGQARATDPDSITAEGSYEEQVTLSVQTDDRLDDHASWRVYAGTRPELRWPRIEIDFGRNPDLIDDWLAVRPAGARITVANPPDQVLGETVDVIVEGYSATLRPDSWRLALACSPAALWQVGTLGTTAVDHDAATLASSATSSATTLSVASGNGILWDTSGADFDIVVDGERMTCTAVSGTSSPQTMTVTRAVNGVVKAHSSGAEVHVYRPLVAAL